MGDNEDKAVDMAAISTIVNPLNDKNILMWWNGADGSLKVNQRPLTEKAPRDYKKPAGTAQIKNPSALTVLRSNDLLYVYGIGHKDKSIYSFSPTTEKVGTDINVIPKLSADTHSKGALAGTSNGTKTWLYYLDDANKLIEYAIGTGPTNTMANIVPRIEGYMTAFYDTANKSRWLAYQDASYVQIIAPAKGDPSKVTGSETASGGTPIAACCVDGKIYVYWVHDQYIYRNVKPSTDGAFQPAPKVYTNAPKVVGFSQLSVTPSGKDLHLYYLGLVGGETKFVQYTDKQDGAPVDDE